MAARDYTLLSKLGFADPDKKDPLHDLGCQYIAQKSVFDGLKLQPSDKTATTPFYLGRDVPRFEAPISKGEMQYKTTIGFVDVVLCTQYVSAWKKTGKELTYKSEQEARARVEKQGGNFDDMYKWNVECTVCERIFESVVVGGPAFFVEVKIAPVTLGDMLRQINLYREYGCDGPWILAIAFDISQATFESLENASILPVRLGNKFRVWAEEQRAAPVASVVEA